MMDGSSFGFKKSLFDKMALANFSAFEFWVKLLSLIRFVVSFVSNLGLPSASNQEENTKEGRIDEL